ncbi:RES domain-containing protein [Ensifer sp. Root423]|uniref:RES domain-containing protein n=1 Tax=Ensifer sp. Root423 TaxID=1736534 RepID=UPI00244EAB71|nr:RES domain-containing protein [Ensifer sp. Root423]
MIVEHLPAGALLYRAHMPEWASLPRSRADAALKGGRFNREGVEALYLALDEVRPPGVPADLAVSAALHRLLVYRDIDEPRRPCATELRRPVGRPLA